MKIICRCGHEEELKSKIMDLTWKTEKRKIKDLKLFDGNPRICLYNFFR